MAIKKVHVKSNIDDIKKETEQKALVALEKIGLKAEAYAKQSLTQQGAVDTGRLRNSVTHNVFQKELAVQVGTNVEYSPYIEFGTSQGMKPRPYIRPSIENHIDEYRQIIETALK